MSYFNAKQLFDHLNNEGESYTVDQIKSAVRPAGLRRRVSHYDYNGNPVYYQVRTPLPGELTWEAPLTEEEVERYVAAGKKAILDRTGRTTGLEQAFGVGKWWRPWTVVPEVRDWRAPVGDYGVGVEVELGFRSDAAARAVAADIDPWEYITLDFEGGQNGIEATFPPVAWSTFNTSRAVQYLDLLSSKYKDDVTQHDPFSMVGTHVNVSAGGDVLIPWDRIQATSVLLNSFRREYSTDPVKKALADKYFGRCPYGVCNGRNTSTYDVGAVQGGHSQDGAAFVEFKLFNSQLDSARLIQYVNIAVCMVELMLDTSRAINMQELHLAMEKGYNMPCAAASEEYEAYQYPIAA